MSIADKFCLYFALDGKDYAMRFWPAVPRVGDHIMFHPNLQQPFVAKVVRVVWGVDKDHNDKVPSVNVMTERCT